MEYNSGNQSIVTTPLSLGMSNRRMPHPIYVVRRLLKIEGILLLIRKKLRAPTRCNEGRALKGVWFPIVRPWTHPRRTPVPRPFHRTQSSKCSLSLFLSLSPLSNPRETFWNPIQPLRFDGGGPRFVRPDQRGISTLGERDPSKGNFCLAMMSLRWLLSFFFFF